MTFNNQHADPTPFAGNATVPGLPGFGAGFAATKAPFPPREPLFTTTCLDEPAPHKSSFNCWAKP